MLTGMSTQTHDIPAELQRAIDSHPHDSLRVEGDGALAEALTACGAAPDDNGDHSRADLAVVLLEPQDNPAQTERIAWHRDIGAQCTLLWLADDNHWSPARLRELGFQPLTDRLWAFDIDDYKAVPDWLNARFWANPERWDQHRW